MRALKSLGVLLPLAALAACATSDQSTTGPQSLSGNAWTLSYFQSADEAKGRETPPRPENYSVEFMTDGTAAFRLDCNRLTSQWASTTSGTISFSPGAMTRAFCGETAWDTRIARDLASVRNYTIVGDTLSLTMAGESGTYVWKR
ncbi:MAG: META domain-containing protein [Porphyrobacter sp.]|nr:META domain-containing protein [Porphyrobacter sp.]